jgi:hypothetical protein
VFQPLQTNSGISLISDHDCFILKFGAMKIPTEPKKKKKPHHNPHIDIKNEYFHSLSKWEFVCPYAKPNVVQAEHLR